MYILEKIRQFAEDRDLLYGVCDLNGICDADGVCGDGSIKGLERILSTPFVSKNPRKRLDPTAHLSDAKSIVVIGLPYARDSHVRSVKGDRPYGLITRMALGGDYHSTLKRILSELAQELTTPEFHFTIKVDSGGLVERSWAVKAGLGFVGKNCMLISQAQGSFFNIGLLITNLELGETNAPPRQVAKTCGDCDLCIKACPGQAIAKGGFAIDYERCVSYITQKPGELTEFQKKAMGRSIFGCDICQNVCPYNAKVMNRRNDLTGDLSALKSTEIDLYTILNMSELEFAVTLKHTCIGWKGLDILQRNARILLKKNIFHE
ncbi:MAG: tRNA epoxyqueuosine(34) reductase QueG [Clostridiales bacterium]|jgi:epoxyqueuosine reductase|nr:tRNA epoxyqueuosine(34) reductase QueG [Clostridiales bacterium]